MVYALHKFKHFLLGNKFVFYVDHMALLYLVNKSHVLGRITRWLLLFLEYEFIIIYKLGKTHVVANVLHRLLNNSEPLGVPYQTMDASLFFIEPIWMQEVKTYLEIGHMLDTLILIQKQKLAKKAEPFTSKEGIMYIVGQDNKMHRCLTTLEAHFFLKELHEGVVGGHFAPDTIAKKILDVGYWWPILFKDTT
jgi:hypothetical protein